MNKFKIPTTQKAVIFSTLNGPLEYKSIPVPKPAPNQLLVNIHYSGVCHSDLHVYKGEFGKTLPNLPLVGGHEGSGVVVGFGSNVTNWQIGDLAGVKLINHTCGTCEHCQQSQETACADSRLSGVHINGTFQQYCIVDALQATKLPRDINLPAVGPILCAGITVYKGLKASLAKPGQWVVISGAAGGLGSLAVQYAKALGLRVIAIDGGGEPNEKEKFVKDLGAEVYIDFTKSADVVKEVHQHSGSGGGAHAALNVSTSEAAIQQSINFVRSRGTVVLIGLPAEAKIKIPILPTVLRQITVKGSYVGTNWDTHEAVDFFARGLIRCPIQIVGLSELERVFKLMEQGKIIGRYVVDTSK